MNGYQPLTRHNISVCTLLPLTQSKCYVGNAFHYKQKRNILLLDKNITGSDCFRPTSLPNQSIYIWKFQFELQQGQKCQLRMFVLLISQVLILIINEEYNLRIGMTNLDFVTNSSATPALTLNGSACRHKHNSQEFNSQWFNQLTNL